MYTNLRYLILVNSLVFILFSCSNKQEYNKETEEFNGYLQKLYKKHIPKDKSCFVLLPGISCVGCTKHTARVFEASINNNNHYLITGLLALNSIPYTKQYQDKVWIDSLAEILNLKLTKSQVTILHTDEGNIKKIYHVNSTNKDSVDYYLEYFDK